MARPDCVVASQFWPSSVGESSLLPEQHPPACEMGKLERLHLFRVDSNYLLSTVAQELRKQDSLKSGVVTAAKFNDVLEQLGLRYGSPEIDLILRFCTVTDDGYVHYKHLLLDISPYKDTHAADSVEEALRPPNVAKKDVFDLSSHQQSSADRQCSSGSNSPRNHVLTPEKSDQIRRLYCMWDRNAVRDAEFVAQLRGLGVPITPEFERLLVTYGPSRTMSFGQFMRALHMNEHAWRKARIPIPDPQTVPGLRISRVPAFYDPKRNPITWSEPPPCAPDGSGPTSSAIMSDETFEDAMQKNDLHALLQRLASDFLNGNQPSSHFRNRLRRLGVTITPELDALMRSHDSDNRGNFKDLMRELHRSAFKPTPRGTIDSKAEGLPIEYCIPEYSGFQIAGHQPAGHGDIIAWSQDAEGGADGSREERISRRACRPQQASDVIAWKGAAEEDQDMSSKLSARGRGGNRECSSAFRGSSLLPKEAIEDTTFNKQSGKRHFVSLAAKCPFGTQLNSEPVTNVTQRSPSAARHWSHNDVFNGDMDRVSTA